MGVTQSRAVAAGGIAGLVGIAGLAPLDPAAAAGLLTHRAVYDLSLAETSQAAGLSGVEGRMVYEFTGGACEGYSVAFRFVIRVLDASGGGRVTDLQTTSFETPDASAFQFLSKTFVNRKLTEETRGRAEREADDGIRLALQKPTEREETLPGEALFPTQHMRAILNSAEAGETILIADVFDGSESGDKIYETTSVIGPRREGAGEPGDEADDAVAKIGSDAHWPVTIAYFDPQSDTEGERTPAYQLGFLLYENGVSRRLLLDYGDFELRGRLSELTPIDPVPCPE
ncbi:cell envelope integrity EipB family protein [Stappia sp.]|uniref:cell envelope integrity EipB family protein n=1 Tax=Stappia sp. TaxID=1870903 RepID=UPI0032D936E9